MTCTETTRTSEIYR